MSWFPKKPTLDFIQFDTSSWNLQQRSEQSILWGNEEGDALSLYLVDGSPDLPPWSDLDGLRHYGRELAAAGEKVGGIISVDVVEVQEIPFLKLIYKYERYEKLPGYGYTGMLIFPFEGFFYVITLASVEQGTTGIRDAVVTSQLINEGKLNILDLEEPTSPGGGRRVKGWFQDPYDPSYPGYILCSLSDDETYDAMFPYYPLSKVRKYLFQLQATLKFQELS